MQHPLQGAHAKVDSQLYPDNIPQQNTILAGSELSTWFADQEVKMKAELLNRLQNLDASHPWLRQCLCSVHCYQWQQKLKPQTKVKTTSR